MSYSAPTTRAVGYLVTATNWNQDVRDNILAIHGSPAARVYHNTTQSVSTGTETALAFNSERRDTDTIHDTATNNSRLTAKTAGVYLITGHWGCTGNAGRYHTWIRLNGLTRIAAHGMYNPTASASLEQTVSCIYKLAVNDYVELVVYQDSGSSVTVVSTAGYSPEFGMQWLGAGT